MYHESHCRGGQQATLSRDRRHSSQRRPRGIGIGSNGLILPRRNNSNDDDDDNDDIEEGRQRRGFDRLRAVSGNLFFLFVFVLGSFICM